MTADDLNAAVAQIETLPRVRFDIGCGDTALNWLARKHDNGAVHEPGTLAAFLACRKVLNCQSIYDVGALFGYFTLFAAMIWDKANLTAIDAHPGAFNALRVNVGHWADCVFAAISDRCSAGEKVWLSGFNIYEEPEGGWDNLPSVPGAMKERGDNNRGRGFIKADFITLDALYEYCVLPPDLLKIDVESYQAKAIQGGLGMISRHRPAIVIELHDVEKTSRLGTTNAQTVKPLFDLGYTAFWCGNFRDRNARFELLEEMRPEHERLSLMVFA